RQDNGNLHLNEFSVTAAPRGTPSGGSHPRLAKLLAFREARADFEQQGWTIAHAIDGNPATAWGIYPQVGRPHHAVFVLKEPLAQPGGTTLTFTLRQTHGGGHLIGRLRLAVTTAAAPGDGAALPPPVAAALAAAPPRTDRQRADL